MVWGADDLFQELSRAVQSELKEGFQALDIAHVYFNSKTAFSVCDKVKVLSTFRDWNPCQNIQFWRAWSDTHKMCLLIEIGDRQLPIIRMFLWQRNIVKQVLNEITVILKWHSAE